MKIVNIALEGRPEHGDWTPRAIAILSRSRADESIEAQVLLPGGTKQTLHFAHEDTPEAAQQRSEAARQLALLLEGSEHDAKSYISIVETMIQLS